MTPLHHGFADELIKVAGLGGIGRFVMRNPLSAIGAAGVVGSTGLAAAGGAKRGLTGAERGRYLSASKHGPSQAAYINYHPLFEHKPTRADLLRLHEHYRPGAFRR